MIGIYLCDDDSAVRHQIQTIIERKILIEDYDMHLTCSVGSAQDLLKTLEQSRAKRGIYFLDVDLKDPNWDGFLLGQELRRRDPHVSMV